MIKKHSLMLLLISPVLIFSSFFLVNSLNNSYIWFSLLPCSVGVILMIPASWFYGRRVHLDEQSTIYKKVFFWVAVLMLYVYAFISIMVILFGIGWALTFNNAFIQ